MSVWSKLFGNKSSKADIPKSTLGSVSPKTVAPQSGKSDPLDTSCRRCKKLIGPGGLRGPMVMMGGDMLKLMEDRAVYGCKTCGAPFCMNCMAEIRAQPCLVCHKPHGW
jgi:hypothetical protein